MLMASGAGGDEADEPIACNQVKAIPVPKWLFHAYKRIFLQCNENNY
jgi:hypothetical protein